MSPVNDTGAAVDAPRRHSRHRILQALLGICVLIAFQATSAAGAGAQTPTPPTATPGDDDEPRIEVVETPQVRATPTPPPADPLVRVASLGETLGSVAAQAGLPVRDLAQRNRLTRAGDLLTGQRLRLPRPAAGKVALHRATPGETPALIAAQYGISPYRLRAANRLLCPACLVVRQWVRVPAAQASGSSLPLPITAVEVSPAIPTPGDAVAVRVTTTVPVRNLTGSFGGRPLRFVRADRDNVYVALTGIGALDEPGVKGVSVRAIAPSSSAVEVSGKVQLAAYSYGFENVTVSKKLAGLLDPKVNQAELDEFARLYGEWTAGQLWEGPLRLPIEGRRTTSNFGARRSYNGGVLRSYHSGMDISAPVNTPVRAMAAGRVVAAKAFSVRGNVVVLDHGRGVLTAYCHLSKWSVQPGDFVKAGDVIAMSGNTGRTEGPHLHFELAVGGVVVDPRDWLQRPLP